MLRVTFFLLAVFSVPILGTAQGLMSMLNESELGEKEFIYQTFKGTRIVNGQSVEMKGKSELEFIVGHRFGRINDGAYNFFGWDQAYVRFGLEYGLYSKMSVGVGRSSYNKIYDGYLKYQVVRQSKGGGAPVTVVALGGSGIQTFSPYETSWKELPLKSKLYYSGQILVARKFSPRFSLQLSPIFIHANRVDHQQEKNNQMALGLSGRYKLTGSISINSEYFYRTEILSSSPYNNCIALGLDIETGGHVFQLIFSNTQGMIDRSYVSQSEGDFFQGDIHFGFNITRTFQIRNKKINGRHILPKDRNKMTEFM